MPRSDAPFSAANFQRAGSSTLLQGRGAKMRLDSGDEGRFGATTSAGWLRQRETKAKAAAVVAATTATATEVVVDGGGVCRDKYLPVNTERLALPSRSVPVHRRK